MQPLIRGLSIVFGAGRVANRHKLVNGELSLPDIFDPEVSLGLRIRE